MTLACSCDPRVKHLGAKLYAGLVLVHRRRCAWAQWFASVNEDAAALVAMMIAAGDLASWLGYTADGHWFARYWRER